MGYTLPIPGIAVGVHGEPWKDVNIWDIPDANTRIKDKIPPLETGVEKLRQMGDTLMSRNMAWNGLQGLRAMRLEGRIKQEGRFIIPDARMYLDRVLRGNSITGYPKGGGF